jgi:hypothetical protein
MDEAGLCMLIAGIVACLIKGREGAIVDGVRIVYRLGATILPARIRTQL